MRKTPNSKPQKQSSKAMGEVRVIAGLWRGRKLPVLNAEGLRPTTDLVKETLFNWLMMDVANARCLDCFAGSGSLGIEALSRQAQAVVFLEKFATATQQLKKNLASLKTDKGTVINTDTLAYLAQKNNDNPFDIIFIDPPYAINLWQPILENLLDNALIHADSRIYLEADKPLHSILDDDTSAKFTLIKSTKVGQAMAYLLTPTPN